LKPLNNPLEAALGYLDHQPYSEQRLNQKLKNDGFTEEAVGESISRLKNWNCIDDRKFGESRIHQLKARFKSRAFVIFDLENHGIKREIITEIMNIYYPEQYELEIAVALVQKMVISGKKKEKINAYLVRNGFSENTVRQCFYGIDPT